MKESITSAWTRIYGSCAVQFGPNCKHAALSGILPSFLMRPLRRIVNPNQKKVLVLMSNTGGGHKASAEAIEAGFKQLYGDKCVPQYSWAMKYDCCTSCVCGARYYVQQPYWCLSVVYHKVQLRNAQPRPARRTD